MEKQYSFLINKLYINLGEMMWNKSAAINYLQHHARRNSSGNCAKYVRLSIASGGIILRKEHSAKDYGAPLREAGFKEIPDTSTPEAGDVAVIQSIPGHSDGHMAMFDGKIWISDFRQAHGMYPGHTYRTIKPNYKIYRKDQ